MERSAFAELECRSLRLSASRLVCLLPLRKQRHGGFFDFGRIKHLDAKRGSRALLLLGVNFEEHEEEAGEA